MLQTKVETIPAILDLALAKRLAGQCESSAAAARGWSVLMLSRLDHPTPMTAEAMSVAGRICGEIATAADDLRQAADALRRLLVP